MNEPATDFVPLEALGAEMPDAGRRRFLSLAAGSLALGGLTGCTRQPTETIMPYVDPPENVIPGRPKYYATAVPVNGAAEGVIVESDLGRPTKVEGNPNHPGSLGATSVTSQASLMDLYDPDRAQGFSRLGVPASWDALLIVLDSAMDRARNHGGAGLRILTETVYSPAAGDRIRAVLAAAPGAQWHQYEPAGAHSARAAAMQAFGRPLHTYYNFDAADVVLSLDADFLACGQASTRYAHDFAARRRRGGRLDMNRLYVVESSMSATGGKADHRLPVRYSGVEDIAREVLSQLGTATGGNRFASAVAADLSAHRGASIVIPGESQSPAVHAAAHALNAALGNSGHTVIYTEPIEFEPVDQIASLRLLAADMDAGKVDTLVILGGNPVYNSPADIPFAQLLGKTPFSIHVGSHANETGVRTTWHVAESHCLETWGDTRAYDGTIAVQQPLIQPLYDSRSHLEILDAMARTPGRSAHDIVRDYWQTRSKAADFESWWRVTLNSGIVANSTSLPVNVTPASLAAPVAVAPGAGIEIVFRPDVYSYDGRHSNNLWLQELPKPMTKLTWDNAVHMSAATAKKIGVESQDVVELHAGPGAVEGSVWISQGHPDDSVTVHLGYGRRQSGRAGDGAGFNVYPLRRTDSWWTVQGTEIRKTGRTYPLATTQMVQHPHERDDLAIQAKLEEYRRDPDFAQHKARAPEAGDTLYSRWNYTGYAWGMSIDLTACVNCNACVVACQAENNIAVVGKEQVLARRAMHWIRIDAYYNEDEQNPSVVYQPLPCMHCEDAPCEVVCPTQATNHSSDGLNDMIYNRCVGTRYCSNNCPYKVRRFNFLLFSDWYTESLQLQRNPDVTVRSRGVMEKCTYCVQRIREAEIRSEDEDRFIRDGEIRTACQQACPTEAIVFGDINNRSNKVAQLKAEKLNYALLGDLNTRPRTTYLAELRNPNPALEGQAS
ncbi:MAG TPA: 4Fe-4S dicluster domain-containing protein [Bryobacteraceae bacterium]|nr:4Fe-4S dicluster domain-containing protein [Bryobacteraceae bacterium]